MDWPDRARSGIAPHLHASPTSLHQNSKVASPHLLKLITLFPHFGTYTLLLSLIHLRTRTRTAHRPRHYARMSRKYILWFLELLLVPTAHVLVAPYTKVEESFTLHAAHDVLRYGLLPGNWEQVG